MADESLSSACRGYPRRRPVGPSPRLCAADADVALRRLALRMSGVYVWIDGRRAVYILLLAGTFGCRFSSDLAAATSPPATASSPPSMVARVFP